MFIYICMYVYLYMHMDDCMHANCCFQSSGALLLTMSLNHHTMYIWHQNKTNSIDTF